MEKKTYHSRFCKASGTCPTKLNEIILLITVTLPALAGFSTVSCTLLKHLQMGSERSWASCSQTLALQMYQLLWEAEKAERISSNIKS